jgi:hypothetical protein
MSMAEGTSVPEDRHAGTAEAKAVAKAFVQQGLRLLGLRLLGTGAGRLWPWRRHRDDADVPAASRDGPGRSRPSDECPPHRR